MGDTMTRLDSVRPRRGNGAKRWDIEAKDIRLQPLLRDQALVRTRDADHETGAADHFVVFRLALWVLGGDGRGGVRSSCARIASRSSIESRMKAAMSGPSATTVGPRFQMYACLPGSLPRGRNR